MFEGELVRLTPITRDDLPDFARWYNDPEVAHFTTPTAIRWFSLDDELDWYESMRKSKDRFAFSIRTVDADRLIGSCSLRVTCWRNREAMLGIGIGDKAFWGRGYGSEATRLLMAYAFEALNLNRVQLGVFSYNTRAIRAYEKAGFVHEATRRQAIFRDGQYHDDYIMGLLREDWLAKRNRR